MIAKRGPMRVAAMLLSLGLLLPLGASADVSQPEVAVEVKDVSNGEEQERAAGVEQDGDPAPVEPESTPELTPEPTSEPTPAPTPEPTPAPTEAPAPEPTEAPKPESDPVVVVPDAPQPVEPPRPEPEPEAKEYTVAWSQSAFASQTVNFQDELVLGLGAVCAIDATHDIQILVNGAKPKGKLKGVTLGYTTSNAKYVTVTAGGKLKGARRGAAQLFVNVQFPDGSQKQLRKNVKVVDEPKIRFAPNSAVLENGAKLDLSQFAKSPILMVSPNVNAGISYSIAALGNPNGSKVSLDRRNGRLSVSYSRPGDAYLITAKTYGGEKATFTIYLGQRTQRIEILVSRSAMDEEGRLTLKAGQTLALKAVAYDMTGDLAARQDITWAVIGGGQYASVDASGQLTANANLDQGRTVIVAAMASDGSAASTQVSVTLAP